MQVVDAAFWLYRPSNVPPLPEEGRAMGEGARG